MTSQHFILVSVCASFLLGQQPQSSLGTASQGSGGFLSPVPFYPPDGVIPERFKDQYVFLEAGTLDLVLAFPPTFPSATFPVPVNSNAKRTIQRVQLASHVRPSVSVKVQKNPSGTYSYTYTITNDRNARQAIGRWFVSVPTFTASDPNLNTKTSAKTGWVQSNYMHQPGRSAIRMESTGKSNHILPGQALSVTIESKYRPGIVTVQFQGDIPDLQPVAPAPVLQQLSVVRQIDFNSVPVLAVGPNFIDSASNIEIAAHFHMAISR